jgi:hypothetical protein
MPSAAPALDQSRAFRTLAAARRGSELVMFGLIPVVFTGLFVLEFALGFHTFDFHTFWHSGRDLLHGRSPYPDSMPLVAHQKTFRPFVYPAPAAVLIAPFALLPYAVADVVWWVIGVASIALALRLLGVRDWRCYGAAFASLPVFAALGNGSVSALLVLGTAALWRYRSRVWIAAAVLAGLVAAKLFLWPLGVWLLVTRRVRACLLSVVLAVAGAIAGWAVIGFAGMRDYPHLLDRLTALVAAESYSPYALFRSLGASPGLARLLMFGAGVLVLAAVVVVSRRPDGDRRAFTLALAAALVLSPIVWPHYLALLFVPIALAQPEIGLAWSAPIGLWVVSASWSNGDPKLIAPVLAVAGALLGWCAYVAEPRESRNSSTAALNAAGSRSGR